jgi:hypothetical protein
MDPVTGQSWADQMVCPRAHQTVDYSVFLTEEEMAQEMEPQTGRRWAGESGELMVPEMARSWAHQMELRLAPVMGWNWVRRSELKTARTTVYDWDV